jgi:hypothetical protein
MAHAQGQQQARRGFGRQAQVGEGQREARAGAGIDLVYAACRARFISCLVSRSDAAGCVVSLRQRSSSIDARTSLGRFSPARGRATGQWRMIRVTSMHKTLFNSLFSGALSVTRLIRPRAYTHLLDSPAPVDSVRLLCGLGLEEGGRRDSITHTPALTTCIGCLRGYAARLDSEVAALQTRLSFATQETQELAEKIKKAQAAQKKMQDAASFSEPPEPPADEGLEGGPRHTSD